MEYDQERIYDRIELARSRMQRQVRSDEIQGQLSDYIKRLKTASVRKKLEIVSSVDRELYDYITSIENLKAEVYCMNCDSVKHVPGLNEVTSGSDNSLESAQCEYRNLERKADQLKSRIEDYMSELTEYFNSLHDDITVYLNKFNNGSSNDAATPQESNDDSDNTDDANCGAIPIEKFLDISDL